MKKALLITVSMFFITMTVTLASNPISTMRFYDTYNYLEQVSYVENNGVLDGRIVPFLMDENTPVDQKAAVINAFTVNNKVKNNAMTFKQFMARKYGDNFQTMDINQLSAAELFCYGYLTLMDEGGDPTNALAILKSAHAKDPASKTIATIYALAAAQKALNDGNKCTAWKSFEDIQSTAGLNNDMDAGIITTIDTNMKEYQSACN